MGVRRVSQPIIANDHHSRRDVLDRRIQDYHGVSLAQVLELIDYLRDAGDSVIAGGSLALGLGNERSDLDVVIAGRDTQGSGRMPLEHWEQTLRVDAWKLNQGTIDDLFERAEAALASDSPFEGAFGSVTEQADLKLLHRVAFGIRLHGPSLEPARTRDYSAVARDLVVREYAERMRESVLVAPLALPGHWRAAAMNARLAVEDALHAELAARGTPFTGDKWLQHRLMTDAPDLYELYRPFAILPATRAAAAALVHAAVEQCEALTGLALSVSALASSASWENTDIRPIEVGADHLLLSAKEGGLWRIDQAESEAWHSLDAAGTWPLADCDEAQSRLCFDLYAQGLVRLRWQRGIPIHELALREPGRT